MWIILMVLYRRCSVAIFLISSAFRSVYFWSFSIECAVGVVAVEDCCIY